MLLLRIMILISSVCADLDNEVFLQLIAQRL